MERNSVYFSALCVNDLQKVELEGERNGEDEESVFDSCCECGNNEEDDDEEEESGCCSIECCEIPWDLIEPVIFICYYIFDILLDISLISHYSRTGEFSYLVLVVTYFYTSSSVVTRFGYKMRKKKQKYDPWYLTMILFLTNSEMIYHYIQYFKEVWKRKNIMIKEMEVEIKPDMNKKETERIKQNINEKYAASLAPFKLLTIQLSWRTALHKSLPKLLLQSAIIVQNLPLINMTLSLLLSIMNIIFGALTCIGTLAAWLLHFNMLFKLMSMVMYSIDVLSDIFLSIKYLTNGEYLHSILTAIFVYIPSVLTTYYSERRRTELPLTKVRNFFIYLFLVVTCGETIFNDIRHVKMILSHTDMTVDGVELKERVSWCRLWEGYLEAIPQLILQLTILLTTYNPDSMNWTLFSQIFSVATSFLGLIFTITGYDNALVLKRKRLELKIFGHFMTIATRLPWLVSRVVSIAALATVLPLTLVGVFLGRVALGGIWWYFAYYRTEGTGAFRYLILESAADGLRYMLVPLVEDTVTPTVTLIHVVSEFIEVNAMTAAWVYIAQPSELYLYSVVLVVLVSSILGIIGTVLFRTLPAKKYYRKFKAVQSQ